MNEISKEISQETRTPIEVLLQMNEAGFVSAKNLYEFLELDPTHYSRWCKDNIIDNNLVDEGIDYHVQSGVVNSFSHNGENLGGRPTTDYLLTIDFAKELCMTCKTEKGRQAREYFKKTEQALVVTTKQYNQLVEMVNQYGKLTQQMQEQLALVQKDSSAAIAGVNALNSGMLSFQGRELEWINEVSSEIEKLAQYWGRHDPQLCVKWLLDEIDDDALAPYKFIEYKRKYVMDNPDTKPTRLTVVSSDSQYRAIFTEVLHRKLEEYGEEFEQGGTLFSQMIVDLGDPVEVKPKNDEPNWDDPAFQAFLDDWDAYNKKQAEMDAAQQAAMAKMKPEDLGDFDDIVD